MYPLSPEAAGRGQPATVATGRRSRLGRTPMNVGNLCQKERRCEVGGNVREGLVETGEAQTWSRGPAALRTG